MSRKIKEQSNKNIIYYMKFIDTFRFMSTSLFNSTFILSDKLYGKKKW